MLVGERCVKCLTEGQARMSDDPRYLADVRAILAARRENDCAPYMVYLFNQAYEKYYGKAQRYGAVKKQFNDLVLSMEDGLRRRIGAAEDPLSAAVAYARIGNYIDFAALENVDESAFLGLFDGACLSERDRAVYESFLRECAGAKTFLLVCDNSGEIVLDKLMIEQLKLRFPRLSVSAMVRGGEAMNDATSEDAAYVGLDRLARIVSNGEAIAGTVYEMLPAEARAALDGADVILSKGQGNFESLSGQGRHVFYSFLCKCDLFVDRFQVPRFTGMLLEEK